MVIKQALLLISLSWYELLYSADRKKRQSTQRRLKPGRISLKTELITGESSNMDLKTRVFRPAVIIQMAN